jgi:hypothetical protein
LIGVALVSGLDAPLFSRWMRSVPEGLRRSAWNRACPASSLARKPVAGGFLAQLLDPLLRQHFHQIVHLCPRSDE